jgi:phospholipid-binding lipoprotein MlaA
MTGLENMTSRLVVRLALVITLVLSFVAPAFAQISSVNADLARIQATARTYADPANNDRVIVQGQGNQHLAELIAANNRRQAETILAAMVIAAAARNPALTNQYVSTVAAAAPALAPGVLQRVRQAYPYRMIQMTSAATAAAPAPQRIVLRNPATRTAAPPPIARPLPPVRNVPPIRPAPPARPAAPPGPDVNFDELAEADAEGDLGATDQNDPFEDINRVIFTVNDTLDTYFFRPLAWAYGWIMPDVAKKSINNAFRNLKSPVIFGNDLLQGEISDAGVTLLRFVINSTVGIAGLFEVAEEFDLDYHDSDFGQTLHAYNIGAGPYIMIPLFGPASARDGVGRLVDAFMDPIFYLLDPSDRTLFGLGKALVRREALLEQLDELRKTSVDYYAAIRSLYFQDRARILRRGKAPEGVKFEAALKAGE